MEGGWLLMLHHLTIIHHGLKTNCADIYLNCTQWSHYVEKSAYRIRATEYGKCFGSETKVKPKFESIGYGT